MQLAAQLLSYGKACEAARGAEQGLSCKLLAVEKKLENYEVAVLELERQVAVLELGENFKRVSDFVNKTEALESERQLAVVELEDNFKQHPDHVAELGHSPKTRVQVCYGHGEGGRLAGEARAGGHFYAWVPFATS